MEKWRSFQESGPPPEMPPDQYTMEIWRGGFFEKTLDGQRKKYKIPTWNKNGGKLYLDSCDPEKMSWVELNNIAWDLGYQTIAYMLIYGLSAATRTRVSNELGAGNPDRAKNAMDVTLGLLVVLALALGHNIWAGFFSDSTAMIKEFASMKQFLAISIMVDSVQGVLPGPYQILKTRLSLDEDVVQRCTS